MIDELNPSEIAKREMLDLAIPGVFARAKVGDGLPRPHVTERVNQSGTGYGPDLLTNGHRRHWFVNKTLPNTEGRSCWLG